MSSLQTDLIGEYVKIPKHGDAGWVRLLYCNENGAYAWVERDNPSRDMKLYYMYDIVITKYRGLPL